MSESFYGGRKGISFTIVEHYDSIADMLSCFSQGGAYEKVGYGQYVIIDTIVNLNDKTSAENGVVFSRGFNYTEELAEKPLKSDYKSTSEYEKALHQYFLAPGAGAIYIGQIVGPQGDSPALEFVKESDIDVDSDDTDSGSGVFDTISGATQKKITYAYGNIRDANGSVIGCAIGFTIPYHVFEINGNSVSAYDTKYGTYNSKTKKWSYSNLASKTSGNSDDDPYHSIWEIKVPEGIHGVDLVNIGIDENKQYYYTLRDYSKVAAGEETIVPLENMFYRVISNTELKTGAGVSSLVINYTQGTSDEINARFIKNVTVDDDSKKLAVTYTDEATDLIGDPIKFITRITIEDNGTLNVGYNTGEADIFNKELKSIRSIALDNTNHIAVTYNTGDIDTIDYAFKFIKNISMNSDQNIVITYIVGKDDNGEVLDTEIINNPINYISKMAVDPDTYHLLCYYSAPAYRAAIADADKASYGEENDWYDLGCIRGETGGIHIMGDFTSLDVLKSKYPSGIPYSADSATNYKGWVCTVTGSTGITTLYTYDYVGTRGWYSLGSLDISSIEPSAVIIIDEASESGIPKGEDNLNDNGIWLIVVDD
jgi:hypothetical protein